MTTMYGADVAELRSLAAQFDRIAEQLDATRMTVGNAIQISAWVGPFAARFRVQWNSEHSLRVHSAAQLLRSSARTLRANADEQDRASAAETGFSYGGEAAAGAGCGRGNGPPSGADFFRAHGPMTDKQDGVRIQKILCDDGKYRYVVYIDGSGSASQDWFGDLGWENNAKAIYGLDNATLDHIRAKMHSAIDDPDAEVAIVGFSQGGLLAQRLADEGSFKTTTVVTYGSPDLPAARNYGGADIIRLEHNSDMTPHGDVFNGFLRPGFDVLNLSTGTIPPSAGEDVRFRAGTFKFDLKTMGPHNHADYAWVAEQFDKSPDPGYAAAKSSLERFGGTVVIDEK